MAETNDYADIIAPLVVQVYNPKDEVIRFCLEIAEENIRRAEDPTLQRKTIAEIAAWFRTLLGVEG